MNRARTLGLLVTTAFTLAACGGTGGGGPAGTRPYMIWRYTKGDMQVRRNGHTLTRLRNGMVLAAGGVRETSAEIYDPKTEQWALTGSMKVGRHHHGAALLPDGRVLVAGGEVEGGISTSSVEIWSPVTGRWTEASSMGVPRRNHTTTALADGRVLVTGGVGQGNIVNASLRDGLNPVWTGEIYDPVANRWSDDGGGDHFPGEAAARLPDGRVLVAGGYYLIGYPNSDRYGTPYSVTNTELFEPVPGAWSQPDGGLLNVSRTGHTATAMADGTVLVVGGYSTDGRIGALPAERYGPRYDLWDENPPTLEDRMQHTATLLRDGRVLVAGGYVCVGACRSSATSEVYASQVRRGSSVYERAEYYLGSWTSAGLMNEERGDHAAVLLENGDVLVSGGFSDDAAIATAKSSELFVYGN